jgi:hypothetical protein
VTVVPVAPGLDEAGLLEELNAAYLALRCDWVYAVEAGEYLFPLPWGSNPRPAVNLAHDFDVVPARTWRVHRHRDDADRDPIRPAVPQRRHGEPHPDGAARPLIVRGGLDGAWTAGRGSFHPRQPGHPAWRISPQPWGGVCWEPDEPADRRDQHLDDPRLF